jgi:hypothetical protein
LFAVSEPGLKIISLALVAGQGPAGVDVNLPLQIPTLDASVGAGSGHCLKARSPPILLKKSLAAATRC